MIQASKLPVPAVALCVILLIACSGKREERPVEYPFIRQLHLKRQPGKPYSEYKAFYLLTEDFELPIESPSDIEEIRETLRFANDLSSKYGINWTHFIDANVLRPAFTSENMRFKEEHSRMIGDFKQMAARGDDFQLHLHGPLDGRFLDALKSIKKQRVKRSGVKAIPGYRQRKSFFFHSFYMKGYRELVNSLVHAKHALERMVYDGRKDVLAFRAGGWDHGSSQQDTLLYFEALGESGLIANSGLVSGVFGTQNWRSGYLPGRNLATVTLRGKTIIEVSPTEGVGGYLNPVLPNDLGKLANSAPNEMAVIVSVYHLGGLRRRKGHPEGESASSDTQLEADKAKLESAFQTIADLISKKVLYPITLRQLLEVISTQ